MSFFLKDEMFKKKKEQTDCRSEKFEGEKKTPFSHHTTTTQRETFIYKVHYLVPHTLYTIIAQKKKKEKRRAGVLVLVEQ